jgi:hypothetical protein
MFAYLRTAMNLCRLTRTGLSFLLHPLDFLSGDEVPGLAFFPGMNIMKEKKGRVLGRVMEVLSGSFEVVSMDSFAKSSLIHERKLGSRRI